jgi:hypothetical protein
MYNIYIYVTIVKKNLPFLLKRLYDLSINSSHLSELQCSKNWYICQQRMQFLLQKIIYEISLTKEWEIFHLSLLECKKWHPCLQIIMAKNYVPARPEVTSRPSTSSLLYHELFHGGNHTFWVLCTLLVLSWAPSGAHDRNLVITYWMDGTQVSVSFYHSTYHGIHQGLFPFKDGSIAPGHTFSSVKEINVWG